MGKIVENMKCGTVKLGFCCSGYSVQKAIDSLREYIVCWQCLILLKFYVHLIIIIFACHLTFVMNKCCLVIC